MTVNHNINAINVVLLEEIVVGKMNGSYEYESDENLIPVIRHLFYLESVVIQVYDFEWKRAVPRVRTRRIH